MFIIENLEKYLYDLVYVIFEILFVLFGGFGFV